MTKFYTDERSAQIVIAVLKAHGIRRVVASPGATNIPITGSIQNDPFFEVYSSVDERSAAYMACGMAHASGEPVVLTCTGATASRNYMPGLTEAWYRKLPIIAVTSTPSVVAVGHLVAQCIDRSVAPNDVTRLCVTLPHVKDQDDAWDCEVKVNRAVTEATRDGGGPVQINIATSYLGTFNTKTLPEVRAIRRYTYRDRTPGIDPARKVAVFIGSHKPFTASETDALERFVATHNTVVLCDHTSAYRGNGRVLSALACMQDLRDRPQFEALRPDLIIHIGEVSGDYPTARFLQATGADVWRVSEDGELRDRFRRLQCVFQLHEEEFFRRQSANRPARAGIFLDIWQAYVRRLSSIHADLPYSNTWIARELACALPVDATLHFGILNSLRNWNIFEVDKSIQTACNVGAFGIDGCVSSLVGSALVHRDRIHFGVIGDLAFFYDLNAIGNRHLPPNLRILLINNGGGVEFELKSHIGAQFAEQTGDFISAAGHFGNKSPTLVRHIAEDLGFAYSSARNKDEFSAVAARFTAATAQERPLLLECFTSSGEESEALERMERLDPQAAVGAAPAPAEGRGGPGAGGRAVAQQIKTAIRRSLGLSPG